MLAAIEQRFWRLYHEYLAVPAATTSSCCAAGRSARRKAATRRGGGRRSAARARQDKISVSTRQDGDRAFAIVNRMIAREQEEDVMAHEFDRYVALREVRNGGALLGHELVGWVRHDVESISICSHCGARLYARTDSHRIEDGEALTRHPTVDLSEVP